MFNVRRLGARTTGMDETVFGDIRIPTVEESLTASYQSRDWRDTIRLTFFPLAGDTGVTPFMPGLTAQAEHSGTDE